MWAPCGQGNVRVECFAENQKWNKWFFIGIKGDKLEVEVEVLGKVLLKKETWSKRNRAVQVVESRTEYLISFFFYIHHNCHSGEQRDCLLSFFIEYCTAFVKKPPILHRFNEDMLFKDVTVLCFERGNLHFQIFPV